MNTFEENASVGFIILDSNWHFIYVNVYGASILKRAPEELIGKMAWAEFPSAIRHASYSNFHQARKSGKETSFKEYVKPSNQWIYVNAYPVGENLHIILRKTELLDNHFAMENDLYQKYTNDFQDLITLTSEESILLYVSPSIKNLLGYELEDMYGTSVLAFCHPEDIDGLRNIFINEKESAASEQGKGRVSCRFLHKKGWYVWLENNFKWLSDERGERTQNLGIWRDISERKIVEDRFVQAQRLGQFGSFERDLDEDSVAWSAEMFRIHGLEPALRIDLCKAIEPIIVDDREKVALAIKQAILVGMSDIEYKITRQDGDIRHLRSQIERVVLDGGRMAVRGLVHDITIHKRIEHELIQSKAKLEIAQEIAGLGHYEWDVLNNVVYVSDELAALFGCKNAVKQMPMEGLLESIHPDDVIKSKAAIKNALQEGSLDLVYRVVIREEIRILHTLARTTYDEWGRALCLFGTVQDITVQKQTEELLRKTEKLHVAGQLAAGIAHEIRNPLTALKGFVKLMCHANEESKLRYYHIMQEEFNRIELILGELLILAKPQAIAYMPHDPVTILDEVIQLLNTEAIMNNVEIILIVNTILPSVNCERNQIKQVFVNVIKNAIEAMPTGGILTITANNHANGVQLQFVDQGQGISEERLPRIGEPFYTTKEKGTGLGMMVSFTIIEEHHGVIRYQSKLGIGTTVNIQLPASGQ
ncbi:PAS domain-containing sensor histidine kinase [Paenibacillus qinlingensis]|uniref:PAS domain-containing sensor histidine kinase n=1 Tax=Paenibacillus qinlingensis TaxID=1837343 RepID=UPI00156461C5|nr:PAS domain-containing sensor histidine kinase [Paenibacillus qinlingensis]NQX57500.1 PAS domain S-box protein [Paenibacillus qinlingensis]